MVLLEIHQANGFQQPRLKMHMQEKGSGHVQKKLAGLISLTP